MTYGIDLRKRVVLFVLEGGSKAEASRRSKVSIWCVNNWCKRKNLAPKPQPERFRKVDKKKLAAHIEKYPDATLKERGIAFNVSNQAISKLLKKMKVTHKKSHALS